MALQIIEASEPIIVDFVPIVIVGPPGSEKTTLAQTAYEPITLDFDMGLHRARNRGRGCRPESWEEVLEATHGGFFDPFQTIVVDTAGRLLELMMPGIIRESTKNGYRGNLSQQGWGVLGRNFAAWMRTMRHKKKNLVFILHQDDSKDAAGNTEIVGDLPGKMARKEINRNCDMIGRIRYEGNRKFLDFNPSEGATLCKNAAGLAPIAMPDLVAEKTFLGDIIEDCKQRLGRLSEASAAVARQVTAFTSRLVPTLSLSDLNGMLPEIKAMPKPAGLQCWKAAERFATQQECVFDKEAKKFVPMPQPVETNGAVETVAE